MGYVGDFVTGYFAQIHPVLCRGCAGGVNEGGAGVEVVAKVKH